MQTHCEQCNALLPTRRDGTPRYKCVIVARRGLPPLTQKVCRQCWQDAAVIVDKTELLNAIEEA